MIDAAAAIISDEGVEGFTLRAAARRAGVSPGAPAHHFGNIKGLLTEVATLAYKELYHCFSTVERGATPGATLRSMARAYIDFALNNPGRFQLMYRKDLVNRLDARYAQASKATLEMFALAAADVYGVSDLAVEGQSTGYAGIIAAWSTAHGIAHLALEEKLDFVTQGEHRMRDFMDRALPSILESQWPG
ncbi:TetR/AcrR family transcriptional regulator [Sphingomonas hengshuiensis]|uniref:TetR/AcrR family transcriptional regulator n=1 Tax=Sphingomonas hengshuiensis TaxID=1609977 RepID=UPI000696340D|nr:TetR/AcrR family transcriptional regulator [Sphingomonas hengshuiensis]